MLNEGEAPLVSIVIPCYNQARFLSEAIESALNQTQPRVEVIVVDDGSTDNTGEVAAKYRRIRRVRQENEGRSGARNAGLRISRGVYVMFLDADDRLMARAAEAHLRCFAAHPEAGLVVGRIDIISKEGSYLRSPRWPADANANHYEQLLRAAHVANTIAVMFRGAVLKNLGGFNTSLAASEDYELLLRVARLWPGVHHQTVVAQYRRHDSNTSRNGVLMLRTMDAVMQSQRPFVKGNPKLEAAYRTGEIHWREFFGGATVKQIYAQIGRGNLRSAARALGVLLLHVRFRLLVLPWKYRRRVLAAVGGRLAHLVNPIGTRRPMRSTTGC